jgi:hypothetical protein
LKKRRNENDEALGIIEIRFTAECKQRSAVNSANVKLGKWVKSAAEE